MPPKIDDGDERLRHMDSMGVDVQFLSTWIDLLGTDLPESAAISFHRAVNEGLAELQRFHPDRFRILASMPLPYGELAAQELQYAVEHLGAVGAMIGTNIGGRPLDDQAFDPFWAKAEELAVPVMLHPVNVAAAPRLTQYFLTNLLGNPFDSTVAASHLIFGGVLDRFPNLRIVLVHGGGYLPYAIGRLDHGYAVRAEAQKPQRLPSSYLSRFVYDSLVYDPELISILAARVGAENMVLGSDYPFDMQPPDLLGMVRKALGPRAPESMGDVARRTFSRNSP